jgi:dipeptidyl aminopeptidase/acylaminoacyl peptidase
MVSVQLGSLAQVTLVTTTMTALRSLAACLLLSLPAAAQRSPLTLADLDRFVSVGGPVVSPDGKRVAFTATRPNFDTNRNESEVLILDVATGQTRPLASRRQGARAFVWADDQKLAFLARGDSGLSAQVIVVDVGTGEERQLTHAPFGVRAFAPSPDRGTVAFSTAEAPEVRTGSERFNDSFEVGNDDFLTMAPPVRVHLWTQRLGGDAPRRLTSGPWSMATSLANSDIEWTPDGRGIVIQTFISPHSGDTDKSRVAVVDAATGRLTHLTDARARANGPTVSPDGRWIAYGSPRDRIPANQTDVHLVPVGGGTPTNATRALDRAVSAQWLPTGDLLLTGGDGTTMSAWRLTVGGGSPVKFPLGPVVSLGSVSAANDGSLIFAGSERDRPTELYRLAPGASAPTRLTDVNAFLSTRTVGRTAGLTWASSDGLTADGVVTYPPGFDASRRYPLVLYIHGGPTAASYENFSTRVQLLAAKGWIVFQPNYRGSNNRGNAFQSAIATNPGPGIDRDVMTGIAALVNQGGVDTTRIGVSGWSFGGYVSAWLIGNHTHWKAAITGAPAMDLFDMYALTDLNVQLRHAIASSPYVGDREEWFRAQSPLTYASKVRTPTLILHDVRDQRVTITQSYKLFHALRDNGVPVQFIAYPIAGHSPTDPVRSRDVHRRWIEWFERHFGNAIQ